MKKLMLCLLGLLIVAGCTIESRNMPSKAVEEYLNRYINSDSNIINELDDFVKHNEKLVNDTQRQTYKEVLRKQYNDLQYEILEEKYDGNSATVEVKITVYDLYKAQKEADLYLADHLDEFKNEEGKYDADKYTLYKLDKMKSTTQTVDYTIEISVAKINNKWEVLQLNHDTLEKIHGIYNYELDKLD